VAARPGASTAAVIPGNARSGQGGARSEPPRSGPSAPSSLARARHRLAVATCLVARDVLIVGTRGPVGSGAHIVDPRCLRRWCWCKAREGGGRGTAARSGDAAWAAWQRSGGASRAWQRSDRDEELCRYAIVADADIFPDLAASSVLGDNGGLSSDLGLAALDLGSECFYYGKLIFCVD
jgi:hypothetical protein